MLDTDRYAPLISLLQIANKANKLAFGHDPVLREIAKKRVRLVILATDLAQNSIISVNRVAERSAVETINFGDKELYSTIFGKYVGIVGILDENFKNGIKRHLSADGLLRVNSKKRPRNDNCIEQEA